VTARAIFLGLVLLPLNSLWVVEMEMASPGSSRSSGPFPTTFSLFANVVLLLTVLAALNAAVRRARVRWALSPAELLTVYVMLCLGSALASVDFLDVLVPMMGHPIRFATPSNQWDRLFVRHIPPAFIVTDAEALAGWYEGNATLYDAAVIAAWLRPVLLWTGFIFVLLFAMLCLSVLVRRRWIDHERLTFPVLYLPLALTDESPTLWRSRLMWLGFGLAGGISLLNGLSFLYPVIPSLRVKYWDAGPLFANRPWSAIGWTPISFYPFALGLGYLLPLDLLFSCWFFYLWWKAERILSDVFGLYGYSARFPYVEEQCLGAYLAIAVAAVWTGRSYLRAVGVRSREGWALLGLGVSLGLLIAFWRWAGLGVGWAALALLLYFGLAFSCARMRAELGPPAHDLHNAGPERVLTTIFGPLTFSPRELTVLTYFYWFNRAYRSIPITHQLEAFKLAERQRFSARRIVGVILLATVGGTLAGFWAHLHLAYQQGASAKMAPHLVYFGWEAFNRLQAWLTTPSEPDRPASAAILFGFLQTLLLQGIRLRIGRWPFHPLGLAVSGSYSVSTTWVPLGLAWLCKWLILRYGGVRLHRRATYFFLGLLLGDYLLGCAWPLLGWAFGVSTYSFQQ